MGALVSGSLAAGFTPVGTTLGGTGLTTYAQGDLLYGSASNVLSTLAKSASATRYLSNQGSNNPSWSQVNLANGVTGNLPVANLDSGTSATATTFWRGDGLWSDAVIAVSTGNGLRGGAITSVGTVDLALTEIVGGRLTLTGNTGYHG